MANHRISNEVSTPHVHPAHLPLRRAIRDASTIYQLFTSCHPVVRFHTSRSAAPQLSKATRGPCASPCLPFTPLLQPQQLAHGSHTFSLILPNSVTTSKSLDLPSMIVFSSHICTTNMYPFVLILYSFVLIRLYYQQQLFSIPRRRSLTRDMADSYPSLRLMSASHSVRP